MSRWREEDGSVVLWLLGVALTVLVFGGISVDLWHVLSERRALVALADAAATAGASGLDEAAFRTDGSVVLSPPLAEELARRSAAEQHDAGALTGVQVAADQARIRVIAHGWVRLGLLRFLAPGTEGLEIRAEAMATPRLSR